MQRAQFRASVRVGLTQTAGEKASGTHHLLDPKMPEPTHNSPNQGRLLPPPLNSMPLLSQLRSKGRGQKSWLEKKTAARGCEKVYRSCLLLSSPRQSVCGPFELEEGRRFTLNRLWAVQSVVRLSCQIEARGKTTSEDDLFSHLRTARKVKGAVRSQRLEE